MSLGTLCRLESLRKSPNGLVIIPFWLKSQKQITLQRHYAISTRNLPRVAQPSIWHSIVPKALRGSDKRDPLVKPQRSREWNPATFFIIIFLLIGSNAIQTLILRNEYTSFNARADSKIALLKEVLDKVQRGVDIDVEKVLGTGDKKQEQEWNEVMKNLEDEENLELVEDTRREKKRLQREQKAESISSGRLDFTQATETGHDTQTGLNKKTPNFY